jgi:membrane-associated phospholipid phosphatase
VSELRNWSLAAVATTLAIVTSAEFLDRPIAWLCYRLFGHFMFARQFAGTPSFFGPLEIVALSIFLFRRIVLYPLGYADAVIALCEASLLVTKLLLLPSKFVFGRTWPLYGHPSYLIDGYYGFNFFTAGPAFNAFPSGHTAAVSALAGILWMMYPRFRLLYLAGAAGIAIALVIGDFHFLSDVLGGGFLGVSIALLVLFAWEFSKRRFRHLLRIEIFSGR